MIFEGVPETLDAKREALARVVAPRAGPTPIIASTTSTILVDDLSPLVAHPERFLNAHWLNPAYLMPLVELSARTPAPTPAVHAAPEALLEGIGKVPVVCGAAPGYIVPRMQALAMNEAARMVEEGVASAEDIDKATRYGFGLRFAVIGVVEFIDCGGGDILYYASRYLAAGARAPSATPRRPSSTSMMAEGRIGLKSGQGFYDYRGIDIAAYRRDVLSAHAGHAQARRPVARRP